MPQQSAGSDARTTQYMNRFRTALKASNVSGEDDDTYIQHYSSANNACLSPKLVDLSIDAIHRLPVFPSSQDWKVLDKVSLSDRNLLCVDNCADEVVVGSADHSLQVIRISKDKKIRKLRTLYSKRSGHSEWVTSAVYLPDGRIASGAMDSKICLWTGVNAKDLLGHAGSITKLLPLGGTILASISYDRSLKIWCTRKRSLLASLHGHTGAVLDLVATGDRSLATAGRDGSVRLWDINQGRQVCGFQGHKGHATHLVNVTPNILVSGGQDGKLLLWDQRCRKIISTLPLSLSGAAVATLCISHESSSVIASTTDSTVTVANSNDLSTLTGWTGDHPCHIYSMSLMKGGLVLTGGGEGTLAIRLENGDKLAQVKVDKNAIRAIATLANGTVVLATDDGNVHTI